MPKKTKYTCQQCGTNYAKWSGKCDNCGAWNSLIEEAIETERKAVVDRVKGRALQPVKLAIAAKQPTDKRLLTGLDELDEVLGGGIMPGSVTLLAGQPGIGKTTLLTQVTGQLAKTQPVMYVSGEESVSQVAMRAQRLQVNKSSQLTLSSSTSADDIATTITSGEYSLVVVDSMQTLSLAEISSAPGTVSQITNSANALIRAAKQTKTAVILVGHVTKQGSVAGPKVLEHLVDVVLNFEGDRYGGLKLVRAAKNRYGSTAEVAIFDMNDRGLLPVDNPSASLLKERAHTDGSVILATMEGNRPLLVEIQALVNPSNFGYPKRTASGFDLNRLNVLVAVLEKRTKLKLSTSDIFINVVGGLKLQDPAADLAVTMAIASAAAGKQLGDGLVVFGEVGLGGEIRSVRQLQLRVKEAKKLGFSSALGPASEQANSFVQPISDLRSALIKYLN